jgi:hypothetical protein
MVETILSSPLFVDVILPFILVFTVVFAVLQKSEILGKKQRQIDAIVALVIGLLVVAFGKATGIITSLMPVLAVALIVMVVFMILVGAVFKPGEFDIPKSVKVLWGIIAAILVLVAVLIISGGWVYLVSLFAGLGSEIVTNAVFIILIVAAIAVVIRFSGAGKPGNP